MLKSFYFVATDDKYVNRLPKKGKTEKLPRMSKFRKTGLFPERENFDEDALPLAFKSTPDTLLNLAIRVMDAFPLPDVYTWDMETVCHWLKDYGYPQYVHAFRVNLINGRRLLLLDASALSDMNIKDFDHIRHITYGIRGLFHFEMAKFGRSITLAPDFHLELYKLMRIKNGTKYETMRRSELLRRMKLIRTQTAALPRNHWDILEHWLKREPVVGDQVFVSRGRSLQILKHCTVNVQKIEPPAVTSMPCKCIPPCQCEWTQRNTRSPWTLSCLYRPVPTTGNKDDIVLSVLHQIFPERYSLRIVKSSTDCD